MADDLQARLLATLDEIGADVKSLQSQLDALSPPQIAQVRNTSQTANLNHSTSWAIIAITGESDFIDADFSAGSTGIVCNFDGRAKVTTHIGYTVSGARVNVLVRAAVGGVGQPIEGKSGYVRNATGHTEASCTAIQYVTVSSGDEVTLQTKRESSTSTTTLGDAGKCMILVEKS